MQAGAPAFLNNQGRWLWVLARASFDRDDGWDNDALRITRWACDNGA